MTHDELVRFLERALHYRPHIMSATEFLSRLRNVDASLSQMVYGSLDFVSSTAWHWSSQSAVLACCILVVCMIASISPAMALFLARLSDAFNELDDTSTTFDEDSLKLGIRGVLGLCVPFAIWEPRCQVPPAEDDRQGNRVSVQQAARYHLARHQDTDFFAKRCEGDLSNLFSSDIAR